LPSFAWVWVPVLAFALLGAVAGAELMLDGFDRVLRVEDEAARAVNRS
jgi:hypothetical protein